MKNRAVILVVIVGAALVVAAFYFGRYQGMQTATSPDAEPEIKQAAQDDPHKAMPQAEQPRSSNTHFTHFRVGQRNIKSILPDGDIMWVGTSGGVIRYDTRNDAYRLFDNTSGLLARGVFHLSKLDDRLVVGTYGGGMSIMKGEAEGWETYNIPHGLADAFVYDVLKARNGDIWIATWSGANRVRNGKLDDPKQWDTFTVENTKGGLPNDWVYALAQGEGDTIWMATEGGLARYVDGKWTRWGHPDGLGAKYELVQNQITFTNDPANYSKHHARQKEEMGLQQVNVAYNPNYIISLVVDRNNIVWCGTWGGGLARFDGKQWKNYTMSDGLPGNHVFMLYEDPQGQLWIGTNNGLARMDGEQFKKFDMHDGLYSNTVFSMAQANDGSYWIGSYGGVAKIQGLK